MYYSGIKPKEEYKIIRMEVREINVEPMGDIRTSNDKHWVIGGKYKIERDKLEKKIIGNDEEIFELKAILNEVNGVVINSLIVKRNDGSQFKKFTLTPFDCNTIGIEYEPNLEILSMNLNWKRIEEKSSIEFDSRDMSTYETSKCDGTIRNIIISFPNIKRISEDSYDFFGFSTVHKLDIQKNMEITMKTEIDGFDNCASFKIGERIPFQLLKYYIDEEPKYGENKGKKAINTLIINLTLTKKTLFKGQTFDGKIGVSQNEFSNLSINDIINVTFNYKQLKNSKENNFSLKKLIKEAENIHDNILS